VTASTVARTRVVVIDHTAELGGAEIALLRLLAALDRTRIEPRVVLFGDGPLVERLRDLDVEVDVLALTADVSGVDRAGAGRASWSNLVRAGRTLPFLVRLVRHLRRLRPDVVVTTSLKADLIGGVAARLARLPLVWHVHDRIAPDYLPGSLVRLVRAASRLPCRVVVNSRATASTLTVPTTLVYPGVGPDWVLDAETVAARRAIGERPVVGLVGRISPTKGQLEYVRAAALVAETHPGAVFRVVGGALFDAQAYAERVRAESPPQVEWTGFVDDPREAVDDLDVLVHASPVPEPFGQVIVEAMVRGVPVVATRAGGAVEIVAPSDGSALGVLVAPGDAEALAEGVVSVLDDPEAAALRARAAHAAAVRRFDAAETAARMSDVWESCGKRPATGRSALFGRRLRQDGFS